MTEKPAFVIEGLALEKLRRRLADAGRNPTLEVRLDGKSFALRVLKAGGSVVAKDAGDEDITNG